MLVLQPEKAKGKKEYGVLSSTDVKYSCKERMRGIQLTRSEYQHYNI